MNFMKHEDTHLSDQQLLLEVDGELSAHDEKLVRAHLDGCWKCRARRQELEIAISDFIRVQRTLDAALPPGTGPHALLKAHLAQIPVAKPGLMANWFPVSPRFAWTLAAFACSVLAVGLALFGLRVHSEGGRIVVVSLPDSTLTPGATLLQSRQAVCAQANTKNKVVPVALQRRVFQEYGIAGARSRDYEVDYLVTPALGGADDIHNLWPHSYSATEWNAEVKDALEDRLRELVCDGSLDLAEAQREIAANWIAAYKEHFHTDEPLADRPRSIQ